jgi:hypothetical protein
MLYLELNGSAIIHSVDHFSTAIDSAHSANAVHVMDRWYPAMPVLQYTVDISNEITPVSKKP